MLRFVTRVSCNKFNKHLCTTFHTVRKMSVSGDKEKLVEFLNEKLGLTPYESKANMALLAHGPLSPQGINQKSGIPRPRTYDVLNSLVGKGLLVEQPGRPTIYAVVDPRVGIAKMMMEIERITLRQLEEKRKTAERLSSYLSELYVKTREATVEGEMVWVTRRDSALIARYSEAIRSVENEFVIADASTSPPEKEIFEGIKHALKKNKSVRVIRPMDACWNREQLEEYEGLIKLGEQIRHLKFEVTYICHF